MTDSPPALDLTPFTARPRDAVIITDFDGTLAPIVDDPAQAVAIKGVVAVLHRLDDCYGRVAIVSGRPIDFLVDRLELSGREDRGIIVSGLYGLERFERGHTTVHTSALRWIDVVTQLADRAEHDAPERVRIERKGLSLTVHVREAPDHVAWARSFATAAAEATGMVVHDARMSYELRPPIAIDKGTVVTELTDGMHAACFIGDDYGDLPAFDALDRRAAGEGMVTVKVAVASDEAPIELLERANLVVDGPAGSRAFLESLVLEGA